VHKRALHSLN
jgi:hypothetical protein